MPCWAFGIWDSPICDEDLVALIVKVATGTTMMVSFDHREAA